MLAHVNEAETDAGPRHSAPGTERQCAVTRTVKPVDDMIRYVVGPDGDVVPDIKRKLPGRGVWITASRAATAEGARRNVFARGFKSDVRVAPDLPDLVERLIERSALDALGIATKAGRLVTGFARVERAAAGEAVIALVHAADAGADGARKLAAAARRRQGAEVALPVVSVFTSAQLDLALGRPNVVHAALLAGPASDTFLARCRSLDRFRTVDPSDRA